MSEISIDLIWKLDNGVLSPGKYSNKHEIKFSSNLVLVVTLPLIGLVIQLIAIQSKH